MSLYSAKTVLLKGLEGIVATVLTIPGIFFENCKQLQITQQPHNREKVGDCSVIDVSKGHLPITKSSQSDKI